VSPWKVPEWCDPAQYGDRVLQQWAREFSGVDRDDPKFRLRQWAWEFLRRNPEYRAAWREHIEPFYDPAWQPKVGLNVGSAHGVPVGKQAVLVHRFSLETFPPSPNDDYPPIFTGTGCAGPRNAKPDCRSAPDRLPSFSI
jgi:hypothetical protein